MKHNAYTAKNIKRITTCFEINPHINKPLVIILSHEIAFRSDIHNAIKYKKKYY